MCTVPLLDRICRECYTEPLEAYDVLKRRGMGLVTVTDHDSIDAAETLRRFPDFFLSEEVSCTMPSGSNIHVGVYHMEERHHIELQRRRDDLPRLLTYLDEQTLFFSINHVFSSLTGRRTSEDFEIFERRFAAIETLNGQMLPLANRTAADLARCWNKPVIGGSDAHTSAALATTYTEVDGASSVRAFMAGLRAGRGIPVGRSGDYQTLTRAVLRIGCSLLRERPEFLALGALIPLIPFVTLLNLMREYAFAYTWRARLGLTPPPTAGLEPPTDRALLTSSQ